MHFFPMVISIEKGGGDRGGMLSVEAEPRFRPYLMILVFDSRPRGEPLLQGPAVSEPIQLSFL